MSWRRRSVSLDRYGVRYAHLDSQSTVPRKVKVKVPPPTQAELIARALDMEEGNIKEHKNYLTLEEEKRKKARLVRETVEGPLVRWISKAEKVKVSVEPPPTPAPAPTPTCTRTPSILQPSGWFRSMVERA